MEHIIRSLNGEIARLQEVKRLLREIDASELGGRKPKKKRSAAARKRMSQAQKKRWASWGEEGAKG